MTDFLTLILAIYCADCLFEISRLSMTYWLKQTKKPRDARGRFVRAVARVR